MPKILDPDIYKKAVEIADKTYKTHSAYKSGFIVNKYKEMGGRYGEDGKPKNLKRWYQEAWRDEGNKDYPVYRPSRRISKETPLTVKEIDPKNLKQQIELKQRIRHTSNLPPFKAKQ